MTHYFYLARCSDASLYAGTCMDLLEREQKHNEGTGAKYTRSRLPVKIVYHEPFETLSEARKREAQIKRWTKEAKEKLIGGTTVVGPIVRIRRLKSIDINIRSELRSKFVVHMFHERKFVLTRLNVRCHPLRVCLDTRTCGVTGNHRSGGEMDDGIFAQENVRAPERNTKNSTCSFLLSHKAKN